MFPFTLRQIEVFLNVYKYSSFRGTAEKMNLSEASVSHHIRTLELQLGFELFHRNRGTTNSITENGRCFYRKALEFVECGSKLCEPAALDTPEMININFFLGPTVLENYVRPCLPEFYRQHPGVNFCFTTDLSTDELRNSLKVGDLDGAIIGVTGGGAMPDSRSVQTLPCGIYGNRTIQRLWDEVGPKAIPFLLLDAKYTNKSDQVSFLKANGISNPYFSAVFQFPEIAIQLAIEGKGALAIIDEMIDIYDTDRELILLERLPDSHRYLCFRENIKEEVAQTMSDLFRFALL